jgi:hypothetical protein
MFQRNPPIRSAAGRVAFFVNEVSQGADLNGDGVLDETTRIAYDWLPLEAGSSPKNLGFTTRVEWLDALAVGKKRLALCTNEGTIDANGDGDTHDTVLRVLDLTTGSVQETGLVPRDPPGPPRFPAEHGFEVFLTVEAWSLGGDLTGDLDLLDDVPLIIRLDG